MSRGADVDFDVFGTMASAEIATRYLELPCSIVRVEPRGSDVGW
jgi:hypothetical protein